MKRILKELLIFLHLDLTKNIKYDRLTRAILKKHLRTGYNCIDVGCHKGEILDLFLRYAPEGKHYAFEPIPYLFEDLKTAYKNQAQLFQYALSNNEGETTFQLVKNAPAYSGIKKRKYDISNPEIEQITVTKKTLDRVVPPNQRIDFIKIDVEGGEFDVMKGTIQLLNRCKPIVLFECGKGASDFYGTLPSQLHSFLTNEIGLNIYTLTAFLNEGKQLSEEDFEYYFESEKEYYFVAR